MQQQIQNNLSFYVTSSFALLPLTGTTSIVSSIVGGVFKLPIAKFIDITGRPEGFAIMTGFATIGMSCSDILCSGLLTLSRFNYDGCMSKCSDLRCGSGK